MIFKNYLVAEVKFTSLVTGKRYFANGDLCCNSVNVIYLITCDKVKGEYIGSAVNFKASFRVHGSGIKIKKVCFGTCRHFSERCPCSIPPFGNIKAQTTQQV